MRTTAIARFVAMGLVTCLIAAMNIRGANADQLKLVFPTTATTMGLPYYVALKKGWLQDLKMEEIYVTGDANASRILISKQADIAVIGTLNTLLAASKGAGIKAINSWQPRIDFQLIARTDKVSSMRQLPGKIFAATGPGGLPDQLIRLLCPIYGIDCNSIKFISVTGGHTPLLQSLLAGRADATLINTLTALKGTESPDVGTIERIADDIPTMSYIYTVVRDSDINDPAKAVQFQAFTDATIKGARYIMEHPDEAAAILHERTPDFDLSFLVKVVKALNRSNVWGVDGGLSTTDVRSTIDLLMKSGGLSAAVEPNVVSDLRFVANSINRLGPFKSQDQ